MGPNISIALDDAFRTLSVSSEERPFLVEVDPQSGHDIPVRSAFNPLSTYMFKHDLFLLSAVKLSYR
jgi:hypothetical protein